MSCLLNGQYIALEIHHSLRITGNVLSAATYLSTMDESVHVVRADNAETIPKMPKSQNYLMLSSFSYVNTEQVQQLPYLMS